MARLFPEHLPDETPSDAERQLYEALRDSLDNDFTIFGQLSWLSPHADGRPREGEADLVIAHPEWGFVVIEVKGGVISCNPQQGWTSNGQRIRDPIRQARSSSHALSARLRFASA